MSNSTSPNRIAYRKSDRQIVYGLVCLLIALLFLTIGVFLINPESISGLVSLAFGLLFGSGMIIFFFRYDYFLKQEQKNH